MILQESPCTKIHRLMSLSVIKPGLLDTIQDCGRMGYGKWGINPGGAMDPFAAKLANLLVGNCTPEAVMEIHFPGPQILFEQNALIAITGGDFSPMLSDASIPLNHPVALRQNAVLHFPKHKWGARCYLSVHGGFCIEKWLNSYSTNLKAGAGGWHGQALKKNDELPLKESTIYYPAFLREGENIRVLPWEADIRDVYRHLHEMFVIPGNEWQFLSDNSRKHFRESNFMIHPSSDRMGYHMKGANMELLKPLELVTSAVSAGTIQLLPDGQLIILMADHQTTGGYPRIGHVISTHLPKLAQLRPSDSIQFELVDIEKAERLFFSRRQLMSLIQRSCLDRLNGVPC
jgi:antagonist of KipI